MQLAPFWNNLPNSTLPDIGTNYPGIRIAQAKVAAALSSIVAARARGIGDGTTATNAMVGYVVTHDIGDVPACRCANGGIHPHNKTEVGRRLAIPLRVALFGQSAAPEDLSGCGGQDKTTMWPPPVASLWSALWSALRLLTRRAFVAL